MAKATGSKTAEAKKKKPATATKAKAAARKPAAAKKPAARRVAAKKVVKKVAAKKPAVRTKAPTKAAAKAKKPAAAVKAKARKSSARPATAKKSAPSRAARLRSAVLEVPPSIIDTTSAAEVAARLVANVHGVTPPHPFGNVFTPPGALAVKRESSALRHVKETLNKPVARQLDGVFGPAPVAPETMRRFLRDQKRAGGQHVRGGTNVHVGQSTVPHRPVGGGGSRAGGGE